MELPTWVYDDVLRAASPSASRLALALYRHGKQVTDNATGGRRAYWKGSKQRLAKLSGLSKRAVDAAAEELAEAGILRAHQPLRPQSPHGWSVPYEHPEPARRGADFAPLTEHAVTTHDDASLTDPHQEEDDPDPIITTDTRVQLLHRLHELGVTHPNRWLRDFGAAKCAAALDYFEALEEDRPGYIRNPAAFLHSLVTARATIGSYGRPDRFTQSEHENSEESWHQHLVSRAFAVLIQQGKAQNTWQANELWFAQPDVAIAALRTATGDEELAARVYEATNA